MPIVVDVEQAPSINGESFPNIQIMDLHICSREVVDGSQPIPVQATWEFNFYGYNDFGNRIYKKEKDQVVLKCSLEDFYARAVQAFIGGNTNYLALNTALNVVLAEEIGLQKPQYSTARYVEEGA